PRAPCHLPPPPPRRSSDLHRATRGRQLNRESREHRFRRCASRRTHKVHSDISTGPPGRKEHFASSGRASRGEDGSASSWRPAATDRKSTRLNSSHLGISYA